MFYYILIVNIFLCDIHLWGGYFGSFVATQLSLLGGFVLNTVYKVPEYGETIGQATKCTTSVKNVMDMILQKILNPLSKEQEAS